MRAKASPRGFGTSRGSADAPIPTGYVCGLAIRPARPRPGPAWPHSLTRSLIRRLAVRQIITPAVVLFATAEIGSRERTLCLYCLITLNDAEGGAAHGQPWRSAAQRSARRDHDQMGGGRLQVARGGHSANGVQRIHWQIKRRESGVSYEKQMHNAPALHGVPSTCKITISVSISVLKLYLQRI